MPKKFATGGMTSLPSPRLAAPVRKVVHLACPNVPALCEHHPRIQTAFRAITAQYIFPLHPTPARWAQKARGSTLHGQSLPLRVSPRSHPPHPCTYWPPGHMASPSPFRTKVSFHPVSHPSCFRQTFCFPRHSFNPAQVILLRRTRCSHDPA